MRINVMRPKIKGIMMWEVDVALWEMNWDESTVPIKLLDEAV